MRCHHNTPTSDSPIVNLWLAIFLIKYHKCMVQFLPISSSCWETHTQHNARPVTCFSVNSHRVPIVYRSDLHTNYIRWVIIFDLVTHTAGIYTPSIHIKIQFVLSVAALKCKHSSHFTTCHLLWNQLKINTSFHPQNQKTWLTACSLIYFISISRACVLPTRETLHSHFLANGAKIICTDHLHADLTFI